MNPRTLAVGICANKALKEYKAIITSGKTVEAESFIEFWVDDNIEDDGTDFRDLVEMTFFKTLSKIVKK